MHKVSAEQASDILSRPIRINGLTIRNRMVLGPMAANGPTADGHASDQTIAFLEERARGGVGLIILGGMVSTQRGWDESRFRPVLRTDRDEFIPALAKAVTAVHALGVPIIAEIAPGFGRMGVPSADRPIISASPLNLVMKSSPMMLVPGGEMTTPMPREATVAEIKGYETEMVASAVRLKTAGFDGIEIAAMMSYFLASFLSPRTNWRTDDYGGSVENRARIVVDMVRAIREQVGPDFVIGLRIAANDYMPDGQGPEGFLDIALEIEKAGIDYVALVYGCYEALDVTPDADGANLIENGEARYFRERLSVPVMMGGLHDPTLAAAAVEEGHTDLVMLARPLLADPGYAGKVTGRRIEDIVRCDRNGTCIKRLATGMPIRCTRNDRMGRESRKPGAIPPIDRILKAPIEEIALKALGSKTLMNVAGKFMTTPD
ncbi:MAG: NADH:flavin oxidoreductase [Sphingomonas adhaesiva]|uniref:NADH:flavin oxidoreductase n=1 Tax=Sphingomonas adhaesiva TaxID=28212 RepID=UPI002FF9AEEE